jgi:hypothetical protein
MLRMKIILFAVSKILMIDIRETFPIKFNIEVLFCPQTLNLQVCNSHIKILITSAKEFNR